nr:hypothetical protein [Tanacetum cinerariifolium]
MLIFPVLTKFKPQYPETHPPSNEIRDEVFQANGDLMKSIQTFLEEFNYIPFEEKPHILFQAWYKFFTIQYAQPEDSNELFQKLLEDLQIIKKELIDCNYPTFFDDNSSNEIATSSSNQEKEGPPQDFDIQLVKICRQKELLCMHDNEVKNVVKQTAERGNRIIESLQNFKVIHKKSTSLKNTSQISSVYAVAPILSTKELEYSSSMGYEHPNTTPEMESYEIIKSGVEELVPILSECEVTSEHKKECDMPVCENSPICDDHSEIFSDYKNDDDILSDDDDFEDIEYVEASLLDPEIVSLAEENGVEEENSDNSLLDNFLPEFETFCDHTKETRSGNTTTHADDSLHEYDSFCFEIEPDQERLINVLKNDIPDDSLNDPLWKKLIYFLPQIIRYHRSSKSDFDNPSFPRPPSEPPDTDAGEEIPVVMNAIRDKFDVSNDDDDDYYSFMFVIYSKMFLSFLSAETIFDPGISV